MFIRAFSTNIPRVALLNCKYVLLSRRHQSLVDTFVSVTWAVPISLAAKDSVPVKGSGPAEEPPRVSGHLQSKVVRDGEAVTLTCRVTGECSPSGSSSHTPLRLAPPLERGCSVARSCAQFVSGERAEYLIQWRSRKRDVAPL